MSLSDSQHKRQVLYHGLLYDVEDQAGPYVYLRRGEVSFAAHLKDISNPMPRQDYSDVWKHQRSKRS